MLASLESLKEHINGGRFGSLRTPVFRIYGSYCWVCDVYSILATIDNFNVSFVHHWSMPVAVSACVLWLKQRYIDPRLHNSTLEPVSWPPPLSLDALNTTCTVAYRGVLISSTGDVPPFCC